MLKLLMNCKKAIDEYFEKPRPILINCVIDPASGTESGSMKGHN